MRWPCVRVALDGVNEVGFAVEARDDARVPCNAAAAPNAFHVAWMAATHANELVARLKQNASTGNVLRRKRVEAGPLSDQPTTHRAGRAWTGSSCAELVRCLDAARVDPGHAPRKAARRVEAY